MRLFYFPFPLLQMEPVVALSSATVMPLKTLSCWMRSPGMLLSLQSDDHCDHSVSNDIFSTHSMFIKKKKHALTPGFAFLLLYKKQHP